MTSVSADRRRLVGTYLLAIPAAVAVVAIVQRLVGELSPLWTAAAADLAATVFVFCASVRTDNSSVYDPYWSVVPPFIAGYWFILGAPTGTSAVVVVLVVVWAVRLTGNWAQRWQGMDDEDWRYREFRRASGRWYWPVSFVAIHLVPTVSVFVGLLPLAFGFEAATAYGGTVGPTLSGLLAILGPLVMAAAVALEAIADRQLREHRRAASDRPCRRGVWSVVQHPNYAGELGFWLGVYLSGLGFGAPWWTGVGFLTMCAVFFGYSIPAMNRHLEEKWVSRVV